MSPGTIKMPKAVKFIYTNEERFGLKVDKFENNYY